MTWAEGGYFGASAIGAVIVMKIAGVRITIDVRLKFIAALARDLVRR
jgi:hypothetical protein